MFEYRSPAADLFFYLWTSVKTSVLQEHLDDLLQHYHQHLLNTLQIYNCDTRLFGYEQLLDEIKTESSFEFGHALQFALFVVQGKKGGEQLSEFPTVEQYVRNMSDKAKEKLYYMVSECDKRGWM